MDSNWFQSFGAEGIARSALLVPVIIALVGAIRTGMPAGRAAKAASAFAPVLAILLGVALNLLAEAAFEGNLPSVNYWAAALIGVGIGAAASSTFKIVKSADEMKAAISR